VPGLFVLVGLDNGRSLSCLELAFHFVSLFGEPDSVFVWTTDEESCLSFGQRIKSDGFLWTTDETPFSELADYQQ